jgi:hypothetical protein
VQKELAIDVYSSKKTEFALYIFSIPRLNLNTTNVNSISVSSTIKNNKKSIMNKLTFLSILLCGISFCTYGQGPKTPPCGIVEVTTDEMITGVQFPKGQYKINVIGMSCGGVMGDTGLFNKFLQLGDNAALPEPWKYLKGAVGAPKFVKGPGVGFRVERVAD